MLPTCGDVKARALSVPRDRPSQYGEEAGVCRLDVLHSESYRYLTMIRQFDRAAKIPSSDVDGTLADGRSAEAADEELARLARALAHPARVRIIRLLDARNACVCGELVDALSFAQSTVSQHLKVLKEAGLIQGEIDGPRVCYCLVPGALRRLRMLVAAL
jgi:DNA-binding transcriptional ArsR family regulator